MLPTALPSSIVIDGAERHDFLSPEWIDAALAIRAEFHDRVQEPAQPVRMNLIVTEVPFGDGTIAAHLDTAERGVFPDFGNIDDAHVTVTLDYDVAKAMVVEQDLEVVSHAFITGRIRVDGDMTRLLFLQDLDPPPDQRALAKEINERVLAITA